PSGVAAVAASRAVPATAIATADPVQKEGAPDASASGAPDVRVRRGGSLHLLAPVDRKGIDDEDVERDDDQRPERVRLHGREVPDQVQAGDEDAEPAREPRSAEHAHGGDDEKHADDERDPGPGAQVAEHVVRVGGVEARLRQPHDAVDDAENAGEPEHGRREEQPTEALLLEL